MVEGRNKHICSIVGGISKRAGQLKLVIAGYFYTHMQPMVLVYLPTKLDDFVRANVGKYSKIIKHYILYFGTSWIVLVSGFTNSWKYEAISTFQGFRGRDENYDRRERIHMELSGKQDPPPTKRMVEEICVPIKRQAV